MKCYNCQTELIWGGDHDCEEDEDHAIVTNLSCPECDAFHLVYWGHKDKEDKPSWEEGYKEWSDKKEEEENASRS
jgi:RNase P subunit RPR2